MATNGWRSIPQLLRKVSPIRLAVVCLILFWTVVLVSNHGAIREDLRTRFPSFYLQSISSHNQAHPSKAQQTSYHSSSAIESSNLTFVHRLLDIKAPFEYQCRTVQTKQKPGLSRSRMQSVDEAIFQEPLYVESTEDENAGLSACQPIGLPVPQFKTNLDVDTSSLFFGASTTLDRLNASIPYWAQWLTGAEASMVVVLHWDTEEESGITTAEQLRATSNWTEVSQTLQTYGLNVTMLPYMEFGDGTHKVDDDHQRRHLSIPQAMYSMREPRHEWFVIMDDDTFFVSLPNLLDGLAQFNPEKPHFIGQLSESRYHFHRATYMAYGGAGVFLSAPVLEHINQHYTTCIDRNRINHDIDPRPPGGDMLLKFCVEESDGTSKVSLELLAGLHQVDLHGDPWGWYESGLTNILTLHHFNTFAPFPLLDASFVSDVCGDCFLQRYRFRDDTIFTNGASIVKYPNGIDHIPFHKVEQTFNSEGPDDFIDSFATRPKLTEGIGKRSWRFKTAIRTKDGLVRQFYLSKANKKKGIEGRPDSVFEVVFHDADSSKGLLHGWK